MYRHHRHRHTLLAALTVYNTEMYNTLLLAAGVHCCYCYAFKQVLDVLLAAINNLQTAYPDGIFIIAEDFNQANLKTVLPKFRVAK